MLDVNKNGKIDPEEEVPGDLMTEEIANENKKNKPLTLIAAVIAVAVLALIVLLLVLSMK